MKRKCYLFLISIIATTLSFLQSSFAATKIYSPNIEKGEIEVEWRGNYDIEKTKERDGNQTHKYAIGYGFTDYWASEIYLIANNPANKGYKAESAEWANRFQLTEQGKNFVDVGLYFAFEKALDSKDNHDEIEAKILLEKQIGKFVNIANFGIERELRQVSGNKAEKGVDLEFAWMTKYNWNRYFEPGFEYYAGFGNYTSDNSYSTQKHKIGPNIYGKIGSIKYDLGLMFGISKAASDKQIKWNMEYEF